jgi:hypothetical protein
MPRALMLLLCATLLVWRPLDFAFEFPMVLPSLRLRGAAGVLELVAHGAVAALAVAAVRALASGLPSALLLARAALVASVAATVQSHYWSVLPHQTMPGDRLPLAVGSVIVASLWLAYLRRFRELTS